MVNLAWTPRLEKAFRKLIAKTTDNTNSTAPLDVDDFQTAQEVESILAAGKVDYVDMDLIKRVSALLLKQHSNRVEEEGEIHSASEDWIHSMVRGSSVYVPKVAPKERSPELDRLMDGFRAQVAEKEYERMISSIDPTSPSNTTSMSIGKSLRQDMKEMKDVKAHVIGIVNVLYTGGAVFTAVYMISGHFMEDLGKRVLLSLLAFVLIVACEAYLYARHASTATARATMKKKTTRLQEEAVNTTRTFIKDKSS